MLMKNPLTPAGIEPATFWFVAQRLNHWATAVSSYSSNKFNIKFQNKISVLCISIYKHASHPIRKLYEVSLASPPSHVIVGR